MGGGDGRHIGLMSATLVGLGGILGGGMLVLAGTAFAITGPSFMLAFSLNGAVAFLTAMSVAEMSTAFPQSGGAYNFAKKVLSVRTAFSVGSASVSSIELVWSDCVPPSTAASA